MYKYKVGDRVHIREDAKTIKKMDRLLSFNSKGEMDKYLGTDQTIIRRFHREYEDFTCNRYQMVGVGSSYQLWTWAEEWLEPISTTNYQEIDDNTIDELLGV